VLYSYARAAYYFADKLANILICRAILFCCVAAVTSALQAADGPQDLLQRIRSQMATHFSQLPNYTCHQVTDRLLRRAYTGTLERVDSVELEVDFVKNKELFSRPGDTRFEEGEIHNLVPAGTIGNGAFGGHVNTIFFSDGATFTFVGTSKKDGHKTFRYEFSVPQEKSHFLVRHASAQGIVGYKGSFWVDAETLDLVRFELKADHIASYIGVSSIEESMRYTLVRIRNSAFLLPKNSQLALVDQAGNYSLNMIRLERCREFTGESVVTYGAPDNGISTDHEASEH